MSVYFEEIEYAILALLYFTRDDGKHILDIVDLDMLNTLYGKGYISDPIRNPNTILFTKQGQQKTEQLLKNLFTHSK